MIARIWHGWTTPAKADEYEQLLKTEVFPGIENKKVRGFKKISLLRRSQGDEVEFITIMLFDDLEAVKRFAGEDFEKAYVPPKGHQVLSHYDAESQHYEIRHELAY